MKLSLFTIGFVVLLVAACDRKPIGGTPRPLPPPESSEKTAAQPPIEPPPVSREELSMAEVQQHYDYQRIIGPRHPGLMYLCSDKHNSWGGFVLDRWEKMEKSSLSQQEKIKIEVGLRKLEDQKDTEYRVEVAILAHLAATSQTSEINKQAEVLFNKWSDRFPQGSGPVPTKDDLEQLDREVKTFFDQTKKLPRISPEQLKAEIAALPPPPKPGSAGR